MRCHTNDEAAPEGGLVVQLVLSEVAQRGETFEAWGPFGPSWLSNETR